MMRKVFFHGPLAAKCPNGISLDADTVSEAVNGACKQLGIKISLREGRQTFKILGCKTIDSILQPSDIKEIHLVPAFSGHGGFVKVIVGAILVALSFIPGLQFLLPIGVSMLVGGLIDVLFPVHKADAGFSHYLGAPGNTVQIGTRIALLMGTARADGQILSYNIEQLAN